MRGEDSQRDFHKLSQIRKTYIVRQMCLSSSLGGFMDEQIRTLLAPIGFLALGIIFFLVIELRVKMLKCRG